LFNSTKSSGFPDYGAGVGEKDHTFQQSNYNRQVTYQLFFRRIRVDPLHHLTLRNDQAISTDILVMPASSDDVRDKVTGTSKAS